MWQLNRPSLYGSLILCALLVTVGCGDDDDNGDSTVEVAGLDLIDRDTDDDAITAYVHGDHWHGAPFQLEEGADRRSIGFSFVDDDDQPLDLDLGGDYTVDLHFHGNDDNVDVDHHGDHAHFTGLAVGDVELHITLMADDVEVYEAPPLAVEVVDDHHHDHGELEVSYFELLDRDPDPHAQVAYVDHDHWHGSDEIEILAGGDPEDYLDFRGAVGEAVALSIGAHAEEEHDDHSHDITLNGSPLQLEATIAGEHGDDSLWISDSHGDHIHFVGLDAGHAHVEFHIVDTDTDEVLYTAPEIRFEVIDE